MRRRRKRAWSGVSVLSPGGCSDAQPDLALQTSVLGTPRAGGTIRLRGCPAGQILMRPAAGLRVLDFSTLLPGPMATLLLAEAGAEVIKLERPGRGDEMRTYDFKLGASSVNFALLNRGKRSIAIDLKATDAVSRLEPLIRRADVLVEQF